MNGISKVALALIIVGALNWLLVGLFRWDLVAALLGNMSVLSRAVYVVVGLCGVFCLTLLFKPTSSHSVLPENIRRVA